jgi:hypothetical protein
LIGTVTAQDADFHSRSFRPSKARWVCTLETDNSCPHEGKGPAASLV